MRDLGPEGRSGAGAAVLPGCAEIADLTQRCGGSGEGLTDAARVDLIRALEELKCAAEGAQAELAADLVESRISQHGSDRGVALEVALARRESHHRGRGDLALASVARRELPCAWRAFRQGRVSEWRMKLLARETACLSLEHRLAADEAVAGDPAAFEALGDRELIGKVRSLACRLEPAAVAERRRRAESERRTGLRPAPDAMTWFSALLPVKDGVAVHAELTREADRLRAAGDARARCAIMADTLVERVLGTATGRAPVAVSVVVRDTVLFGDDDGGGHVEGYGEVPGDLLREWIADDLDHETPVWVRRLYETPETGDLVAMDSKARRFTGRLAEFLRLRDRGCRTPYCDAPVRHLDHAVDHARGGPTSAANAQGLCEECNYAKQATGWSARPRPGPRHTIETVTPTGHRYNSVAPALSWP